MLGKTKTERQEISEKIRSIGGQLARQLAALIVTQNDAELGRIIRSMAEQYLAESLTEWVDENWREWR